MLSTVAVDHYRSLRRLRLPLGPITVVTGANGTGKSNIYRTLRLLSECAHDGVIAPLAREGGLSSTLWAGKRQGKDNPVNCALASEATSSATRSTLGCRFPMKSRCSTVIRR